MIIACHLTLQGYKDQEMQTLDRTLLQRKFAQFALLFCTPALKQPDQSDRNLQGVIEYLYHNRYKQNPFYDFIEDDKPSTLLTDLIKFSEIEPNYEMALIMWELPQMTMPNTQDYTVYQVQNGRCVAEVWTNNGKPPELEY